MKIGFIIRGLTYFKALGPLIESAINDKDINPVIFYYVGPTDKKYDAARPHLFPRQFQKIKHISFITDKELVAGLSKTKPDWLVGIILAFKEKNILNHARSMGIKTMSIPSFTDGFWVNRLNIKDLRKVTRNGYMSNYSLKFHKTYAPKGTFNNCFVSGMPMMDAAGRIRPKMLSRYVSAGEKYSLVMLPNIRRGHYKSCFGGIDRFVDTIKALYGVAKSNKTILVAKSRKKQWHPPEINSLFKNIFYDTEYCPSTSMILAKGAYNVVCFNSSSVFESFASKKFCININMNLSYSVGSGSAGFREYYQTGIYNYDGVVKTVKPNTAGISEVFNTRFDTSKMAEYSNLYCAVGDNSIRILKDMKTWK